MSFTNLYFFTVTVAWLWIQNVYCQNTSTTIVTKDTCITNSDSAIVFNPSLNDQDFYYGASEFYPIPSNKYNCNLGEAVVCTSIYNNSEWTVIDSINSKIKVPLTDRRWEDLPVHEIQYEKFKNLKYTEVFSSIKNGYEFVVPISLRVKMEAHIFLCEDEVTNSACYWVMLEAFQGNLSAIRKCSADQISKYYNKYPDGTCKEFKDFKNHTDGDRILNEHHWVHFALVKTGHSLIVEHNSEVLLKFEEKETDLSYIKRIFFHSKAVGFNLWKLHDYNFMYSTRSQSPMQFGGNFELQIGPNCIAFFAIMCSSCKLYVAIQTQLTKLHEQDITTTDEKWKEVKIVFESKVKGNFKMYVGKEAPNAREPFWAIDFIRQCSTIEYRVLKSPKENAPCQAVADTSIINIPRYNNVNVLNCTESEFGSSCISCKILGKKFCPKSKYCELVDSTTSCYCTSGYDGADCTSCEDGYYGQGCNKKCGFCSNGCDNVRGYCKGNQCENDFTGQRCDKPPGMLLRWPPRVENIEPRSCDIYMDHFDVIGNEQPLYYMIEYKESINTTWQVFASNYIFNVAMKFHLEKLEPDTEYCVRAVLYSDVTGNIYRGNAIKTSCFNTSCVHYDAQHIHISTTNTSAEIQLLQVSNDMCQIRKYKYTVEPVQKGDMEKVIVLKDLKPNTSYKFKLYHVHFEDIISQYFYTKEGVPSNIINLKISHVTPSSAELAWEMPKEPNGKVEYVIKTKKYKKKECPGHSITPIDISTDETKIGLPNLESYSKYNIEVCPRTSWASGECSYVQIVTNSTAHLTEKEYPSIENSRAFSNNITFELKLNCSFMRGPIRLNVTATCQTDWCDKEVHYADEFNYDTSKPKYIIGNLSAFTDYIVELKAFRDRNDDGIIKTRKFTTTSSVPNKIRNIEVTSKDSRSISLRWKPPYPPSGVLSKYKFQYGAEESEQDIKKCKLWPDYHCATIVDGITPSQEYYIKLLARNEGAEYVSIFDLPHGVTAKIEEPKPPYGVDGKWTNNSDLEISWKHPNATNGPVKKFVINVSDQTYKKDINSENDYNLTYFFTVPQKDLEPCSQQNVSVTVFNQDFSKSSHPITKWSPPITPSVSNETIKIINETNEIISIKISKLEHKKYFGSRKLHLLISSSTDIKSVEKEILKMENLIKDDGAITNLTYVKLINSYNYTELPIDTKINLTSSIEFGKRYRIYTLIVDKCYGQIAMTKIVRNPFLADPQEEQSSNGIYALLLLILLIPVILYVVYKRKQNTAGSIISIFKCQRKKDVDEVPLEENQPPRSKAAKPVIKPKPSVRIAQPVVTMKTNFSNPIKIIDFEMYVKQSIESGELQKQHELFPRGQTMPWDYGALKVNKSKNRYNNLVAYDHTRVKLAKIDGDEYSDYINANYIDGYRVPKAYIATQGPKGTTLDDFWRMIWQKKVRHIVMLANIYEGGKKKVEKYWPSINEEMNFNGILVQFVSSEVYANYEYRTFKVSNKNQIREITQLHFTTWPDHGIPLYSQSLVPFLQQMLKFPNNSQSPVLVHCSAGVGRTGTVILCDIMLRMAAGEGSLDFLAHLEHLRSQRPNMVDNVEQYKLAHLVVLECLFGMHTSIPCDDNMKNNIEKILDGDGLHLQLKYLNDTEWQDKAMDSMWSTEDSTVYPEKNRFQNILPNKNYKICLTYYPHNDPSSSYINAVQVDGFRSPGRYIVTQQPLPNTVGDFWRMVWERQCTVIISLNKIDGNDKTSCKFWPKKGHEMNPVDYLTISCLSTKITDSYHMITVQLVNKKENEGMQVNIISLNSWKPTQTLPSSMKDFLLFWEECDILSRKSETIVVTCYDGATASGVYIATTFLIEKIKLEQECDVCLAVRTIRHNRRQFITSEEQFGFLYKISLMYLQGFDSYANFN